MKAAVLLLPSAYRADDFDGVAIGELDGDELAARNNLAVAFHSDPFAFQPQIADQIRHLDSRFELPRFSVNAEPDHFSATAQSY